MRVALYGRVSDPSQDPLSQMPRLDSWASSGRHEVVLRLTEVATSRLVRRPLREQVMQEARGRHIQAVCCVKLDRWGRSLIDLKTSLDELQGLGCHFYAIDQGLSLKGKHDPMANFLLGILGAAAELERDLISERTRQSMAYVKSQGRHTGRPKRGMVIDKEGRMVPDGGLERVPFPRADSGGWSDTVPPVGKAQP